MAQVDTAPFVKRDFTFHDAPGASLGSKLLTTAAQRAKETESAKDAAKEPESTLKRKRAETPSAAAAAAAAAATPFTATPGVGGDSSISGGSAADAQPIASIGPSTQAAAVSADTGKSACGAAARPSLLLPGEEVSSFRERLQADDETPTETESDESSLVKEPLQGAEAPLDVGEIWTVGPTLGPTSISRTDVVDDMADLPAEVQELIAQADELDEEPGKAGVVAESDTPATPVAKEGGEQLDAIDAVMAALLA